MKQLLIVYDFKDQLNLINRTLNQLNQELNAYSKIIQSSQLMTEF